MIINMFSFTTPSSKLSKYRGAISAAENFKTNAESLGHTVNWYFIDSWTRGVYSNEEIKKIAIPVHIEDLTSLVPQPADLNIVHDVIFTPNSSQWSKREKGEPNKVDKIIGIQEEFFNRLPNVVLVNCTHKLPATDKHLWNAYPELIKIFDGIVSFGPGDEIFEFFENRKDEHGGINLAMERSCGFIQHNALNGSTAGQHPEWVPATNKKPYQFCWNGRGITWKGWPQWMDFPERCMSHDLPATMTMNGIIGSLGNVSKMTSSMKPKVFLPYIDFHRHTSDVPYLYDEPDGMTHVYGPYDNKQGLELISHAAFALYTTTMESSQNFWPEYSTLEPFIMGTILCVPANYFQEGGILEGRDWEEMGLIPLPVKRKPIKSRKKNPSKEELNEIDKLNHENNVAEEKEWGTFLELINRLTASPSEYDAYRERAFNVNVRDVDWKGITRKTIEIASRVKPE